MNPALVIVDAQCDYLDTPGLQPTRSMLIARTAALLDGCRQRNMVVAHVWTTVHRDTVRRLPHWKQSDRWWCVGGTDGHKTPDALAPRDGEAVVHKSGFNGFASGEMDAVLRARGCDTVVLAGLHLHTCVRAIAVEALERDLRVYVADDAVASDDPVLAAGTRRWLGARCVEFLSTNDLLSRIDGRPPSALVHRSPRETDTVLFDVPIAGKDAVAAATSAAQSAWRDWRRTSLDARIAILDRAANQFEAAAPDLARQMAVEIGKPISHGLEEARRTAASIRDVIRHAESVPCETRQPAGLVRHQPVGVVAMISPWNNPVAIAVGKIAPALIYGNTVVWKPAPAATNISRTIVQGLRTAGVPDAAVQMITGDHSTAQTLAADGNVDAVTITSAAQAGHAIQEICARRFVPVQAELSGNNAAIVWDDADITSAAREIVWAAFGFAGQRCTANRRVIVSRVIADELLRELTLASSRLVWGDPLEPDTDIGPVIHASKREEHVWLVSRAPQVIRPFAHRADEPWTRTGAYAEPVIVVCDDEDDLLVQEETMSPMLVVQRADDFDRALDLCNGVRHGLAAALFSESAALRETFLAEARAGILKVNAATAGVDVTLPFGGWKQSGLGPPEHGEADRLFYTRMQAVYDISRTPD